MADELDLLMQRLTRGRYADDEEELTDDDRFLRLTRQDRKLAEATEKAKDQGPQDWRLAVNAMPFGGTVLNAKLGQVEANAWKRYQAGEADADDLKVIATSQRQQELRKGRSYGRAIVEGLSHVPAILGEAAVATPLAAPLRAGRFAGAIAPEVAAGTARLGVQTAAMPSMWLEDAQQRAQQKGGDLTDPETLAPALTYGAIQTAVLGRLGKPVGSDSLVGRVINKAGAPGRWAARTGIGLVESEAAGAIGEVTGLTTHYGPITELAKGDGDWKDVVAHVATFAAFSALHAPGDKQQQKAAREAVLENFRLETAKLAAQGFTPEQAGAKLKADFSKLAEAAQRPPEPAQPVAQQAPEPTPAPPAAAPEVPAQPPRAGEIVAPERPPAVESAPEPPPGPRVGPMRPPVEATPESGPLGVSDQAVAQERLNKLFQEKGLTPKEQHIIRQRVLNSERTLDDIAKDPEMAKAAGAPISRQAVEKAEKSAMKKLGGKLSLADLHKQDVHDRVLDAIADGQTQGAMAGEVEQLFGDLEFHGKARKKLTEGEKAEYEVDRNITNLTTEYIRVAEGLGTAKDRSLAELEQLIKLETARDRELRQRKAPRVGEADRPTPRAEIQPPATEPAAPRVAGPDGGVPAETKSIGRKPVAAPEPMTEKPVEAPAEPPTTDPHIGLPFPETAKRISQALFGRGRGPDHPNFQVDPDTKFPAQAPSWDVVKQTAANQIGARNVTEAEQATTAHAWYKNFGDGAANLWAATQHKYKDLFPIEKNGLFRLTNGREVGLEETIKAELASPGSQSITPGQRDWIHNEWKPAWEKRLREMQAAGVKKFYDANGVEKPIADLLKEGYFPRTVEARSEIADLFGRVLSRLGGGKPGTKPTYRKGRVHATEEEGVRAGTKYKTNFIDRASDFFRQSYREQADHMLATDAALQGVDKVTPFFKSLLVKNKSILQSLNRPERDAMIRQLHSLAQMSAPGNVHVAPAFRGKEYPAEVKRQLEIMYGERSGRILRSINLINQELKALQLGADVGWATLQLQGMMFSNPIRAAKTTARAVVSFFKPGMLESVLERPEYKEAASQFVQSGGSFGMPEFMSSLQPGHSLVGKVPLVGPMYERFGRAFRTAMDLAKLELWLANRPKDQAQWPRAVEAIENSLGSGRMEQIGMSPERAFLERFTLLAPSYYRGYLKLIQQAGQGGDAGYIARKQLLAQNGGVVLTTVAALSAMVAAGLMTEEEMGERLNPSRGKFLTVPVPVGDGKSIEVGFGGLYISGVRLAGNMQRWHQGKSTNNPYIRWYRGHAAVAPRLTLDLIMEEDVQGQPISPTEAVGKTLLPIGAQQMAMGEGTPLQRFAEATAGAGGLRAWPSSDQVGHNELVRQKAKEKFGKSLNDLTLIQKASVIKAVGEARPPSTLAERIRGQEMDDLRQKRLEKALNDESRAKLKELGKVIPSYDWSISIGGVKVPLTDEQADQYERLLAEEYDKAIKTWKPSMLKAAAAPAREKYLMESLKAAKERANARLMKAK